MILEGVNAQRVEFPSLDGLGRDLLDVPRWRRVLSLIAPFALALGFFVCADGRNWPGAIACTMLGTFFTYGSISHDLVHRTLRLPHALNELLLCTIELLAFRSGHAYRWAHLNHHAHFPDPDDLEGAAAGMPWWRALLDGTTLQPRLWALALRRGRQRAWIVMEGVAVLALLVAAGVAM